LPDEFLPRLVFRDRVTPYTALSTGCIARRTRLIGFGMIARFTILTGCMARRSPRGTNMRDRKPTANHLLQVAAESSRRGSSTSGVPYSTTARMTVAHPTPSRTATDATSCWSSPTSRQASRRARSVRLLRARRWSLVSLHVFTSHAGSGQRHSRLSHSSVTGRPAEGGSRTSVHRLPCGLAATPHSGHHAVAAVVSMTCSSSPNAVDTQQDEPAEREHGRASTTVMLHLGPLFRVLNTTDLEAPGPTSGPGRTTCRSRPTTLHDEEPDLWRTGRPSSPAAAVRALELQDGREPACTVDC